MTAPSGGSMVDRLALVDEGDGVFTSPGELERQHVFGGLLVGQALRAAHLTVKDGRQPCSLHASFVLAGRGTEPIRYERARTRHAALEADTRRMSVSLDHAVWFHRPARVDEWLLYELIPVSTAAGRGLAIGTIRDQQRTLIATVAQEVLLRERSQ